MDTFSKLKSVLGSVKLENNGATARDHLANERTFLAWLRTSLAFASIGVAVTQFFRLQSSTNLQNLLIATTTGQERAILTGEHYKGSAAAAEAAAEPPVIEPGSEEFFKYLRLITQQDEQLSKYSTVLGGWFIATGIMVIMFGLWRYFLSQHYLQQGKFPASRFSVVGTFFVTMAVSIPPYSTLSSKLTDSAHCDRVCNHLEYRLLALLSTILTTFYDIIIGARQPRFGYSMYKSLYSI